MEAKHRIVEIHIDDHDGQTRANARLLNRDGVGLAGTGLARLNPDDKDVPEIGAELAVARALSDLSRRLLDATAADIENVTHEHAVLRPR